jgi:hypothetical protein
LTSLQKYFCSLDLALWFKLTAVDYYQAKCKSKPKMVALGAVMHKVCNIIFAILRDEKAFEIITPSKHNENYQLQRLAA